MENYVQPPISGPRPIGQLAAIAVGAYTEIVSIIAPAEAAAGDTVSVEVRVRNLYTDSNHIAVTGHYDGVDITFKPDYAIVDAGATYSFTFSGAMPNKDIRLHVWSFYWTGTEWYQDDYSYVDIALAVAPPVVGVVSVQLINPPARAEEWYLTIWEQARTTFKTSILDVPITQSITFEDVPQDWFPLRVFIVIYKAVTRDIVATYQSYDPSFAGWIGEVYIPSPGSYYFNCATKQFVVPELYIDGEWSIAYIWWEGKAGWNLILSSNNWPANMETTTAWVVRNTGTQSAFFKVSFMGLESDGVLLNPGEEATLYLYPVTPSPGAYSYTLQVIADSQIVDEYPIEVTTTGVPEIYKGKISRKELEYDHVRGRIPVY